MAKYIFDNSWQKERERLAAQEQAFDPGTIRVLTENCGIGRGWHCLEVGAGGGSIAQWMCQQVGSEGSVVATDIDTRFLDALEEPNLTVLTHDITKDELPAGEFDLIHMRLLLDMMPDKKAIVRKLMAALRPSGYLVLEEFDLITSVPDPSVGADNVALFMKMQQAWQKMSEAKDVDTACGRKLFGILIDLGLTSVEAQGRAGMRQGGAPNSGSWRLAVERMADSLVATGLVTAEEIDQHDRLLRDSHFYYLSALMISAWGRKAGLKKST